MIFNIQTISSSILSPLNEKILKVEPIAKNIEVFKDLSCKIALIQNTLFPKINNPIHLIMVANNYIPIKHATEDLHNTELNLLLQEKASINLHNYQNVTTIKIINLGSSLKVKNKAKLIHKKIGKGVRNYFEETAMDYSEYEKGIKAGAELIIENHKKNSNCISFGAITHDNQFSLDLITAAITNANIENCLTLNPECATEVKEKITLKLKTINSLHNPMTLQDTMCAFGNYDITTIVGGVLKAAELQMCILVENYITATAVLYAYQLNEKLLDYCIFINQSPLKGHKIIIDYFEKKTILNLDYKSNTGVGVPIAIPIIEGAIRWLNQIDN